MCEKELCAKANGFFLTGSELKIIALVCMLIDHTACTVVNDLCHEEIMAAVQTGNVTTEYTVYIVMRAIGRLAFPIYIFLLTEGLQHTRDQRMYFVRMLFFAGVSEIPFDLAMNLSKQEIFAGKIIEFHSQNVFWTLSLGLLVMIGMETIQNTNWRLWIKVIWNLGMTLAAMAAADLLHTDYGAIGVLAIVMMYLLRRKKMLAFSAAVIVLLASSWLEVFAFAACLPLAYYNGRRGWKGKWLFYVFYPLHLLLLWLLCVAAGLR